jgi:hypothetical protein
VDHFLPHCACEPVYESNGSDLVVLRKVEVIYNLPYVGPFGRDPALEIKPILRSVKFIEKDQGSSMNQFCF